MIHLRFKKFEIKISNFNAMSRVGFSNNALGRAGALLPGPPSELYVIVSHHPA